ncbi:helix-turn-helix domain-containing protein [Hoeflea sp. TYP-13]|uniref:helix-turn-helix domain-containing protein n=1 Tax=Hoeflea sp. TYP-13 TaxID=3230023 RepID=UPI0034C62BAC
MDLSENLRLLCDFEHSVSDACRSMGINRQQFSKYLSGISKPSTRNLNKICHHFQVRPSDLFLPHDEFANSEIIESRRLNIDRPVHAGPRFRAAFDGHSRSLNKYLGYYLTHFYSFSWKGLVLCALTHLFNRDGQICTRTIERSWDPGSNALFLSKYDGQVALLGNRLFVTEYQSLAKDAIVETVLYPAGRGQLTYLRGVTFGLSSRQRNPYMSRVVWRYLGSNIDIRSAMNSVGLFDPAARKIDPHVLQLLGEPQVRGAELQFDLEPH